MSIAPTTKNSALPLVGAKSQGNRAVTEPAGTVKPSGERAQGTRDCFECGATESIHAHHVVPRSIGGTRTIDLCHACHAKVHGDHLLKTSAMTRRAIAEMRRNGLAYCAAPFGFVAIDGLLIEHKAEAKIVGEILRQRECGASLADIANHLNANGIEGKRGGRWFPSTVRYLIQRQAA